MVITSPHKSMLEDLDVPGLGLQHLAVINPQIREVHAAGDEQADHDQDGDERLCGHHENKQREEAPCQRADRDRQLVSPEVEPTLLTIEPAMYRQIEDSRQ